MNTGYPGDKYGSRSWSKQQQLSWGVGWEGCQRARSSVYVLVNKASVCACICSVCRMFSSMHVLLICVCMQ